MANYLVNGLYPVDYFDLVNVNKIDYPNQQWWASKERYASYDPFKPWKYLSISQGGIQSREYLEIDLGRVREINFLELNIIKMPINISIEFDALSDSNGNHNWIEVQPLNDTQFDSYIAFEATRNSWNKCNFYFTDSSNRIVKTRFLRIGFTRRDITWPARNTQPFRWPVIVKDLRIGRSISSHQDTIGPIFISRVDNTNIAITPPIEQDLSTKEIRQRFSIQEPDKRGAIVPDLLGFGFLTNVEGELDIDAAIALISEWAWQLIDITTPTQASVVDSGIHTGSLHSGDKVWVDVNFALPIKPTVGNIYELRLKSLNSVTSNTFYTNNPNTVPGVDIPGEFNFTYGTTVIPYAAAGSETPLDFASIGNYIQKIDGYPGTFEIVGVSATDVTISKTYTGLTNTDAKAIRIFPVRKYNTTARTWQATTGYTLGQFVLPTVSNGHIYRVITAGTTSGTEQFNTPELPEAIVVDGSVVFQEANNLSGEYKPDASQSLTMRLWADVADTGQDILGNKYRYATRRDKSDLVFDETNAGWLSAPQPSPRAVESLYFDIRTENPITGLPDSTELDAIRIAPRTHGVWMHVYYTSDMTKSKKPTTQDEWDSIVWTPLNQTYVLTGNSIYQLPHKLNASFIKLEFSNLKPLPYNIPDNPPLPAVKYRRYPSWVELSFEQNEKLRRTTEDWFLRKSTRRERKVLQRLRRKHDDRFLEFKYKQRVFLSALAGGAKRLVKDKKVRQSGTVSIQNRAIIDNVTASKIYFRTNKFFRNHLQATVDQHSILGEMTASRFNYKSSENSTETRRIRKYNPSVVEVSTGSNRINESYAELLKTPMWFNTKCIHQYREQTARFNKKAYFVGIREVEFLRNDYTIVHDDELIDDILHDGQFLESNSFVPLTDTTINDGQTVYVSYMIAATESTPAIRITDEAITLNGFSTKRLTQEGGAAIDKRIFSQPNQSGIEYALGEDYDFAYKTSEAGFTLNYISRSNNHSRLGVRDVSTIGFAREDAAFVTGKGHPGSLLLNEDAGTVTGVGTPVTISGTYGAGVYGKDGGTYNILDVPDNPGPGNLYVD